MPMASYLGKKLFKGFSRNPVLLLVDHSVNSGHKVYLLAGHSFHISILQEYVVWLLVFEKVDWFGFDEIPISNIVPELELTCYVRVLAEYRKKVGNRIMRILNQFIFYSTSSSRRN